MAKDGKCTPQDVVKAFDSLKTSLGTTEDKSLVRGMNMFKTMVKNPDVNKLFQVTDLTSDEISHLLNKIASGEYKNEDVINYLQSKQKPSGMAAKVQTNTNSSQSNSNALSKFLDEMEKY